MQKQIFRLRGLVFSYYAMQAVLLPFLPLYFAKQGYDSFQVGVLMMIGPFVAVFAQPMWGYISDRMQTVKKIVFLLWVCTVLSSVVLFTAQNFAVSITFSLLLYFFMMPSSPLLDGLTITSASNANISYGSIRMWGSIGFTVVAITAPFAINAIGGILNIKYIYWAVWLPAFIFLFLVKDVPSKGASITLKSFKSIFANRSFLFFLLMVFILMIPHRMNDGLYGLHLSSLGATATMVGWAWAIAAFGEVPAFALLGKYMHKFNELALLGVAGGLYALRWVVYALVQDPWLLMFLQVTASFTFGVFWVTAVSYAVRLVPEHLRSTGQSVLAAVFLGLAGITGGSAGGWIRGEYGGAGMYWFGAVLAAVASGMFFYAQAAERKNMSEVT
ncbi:MFS transporter [Paenibacillus swuensis]|uniref:MFS transporter n=1 Tax=Paenibacillus swuensis TaxID=1178515 RepID=A0A172TMU8_9BACL|nr:MFS transporter [Paenibacillus swuensis]ANE48296.1 MFS transporter [Paenibacillus swuensis]